MGIRGTLFGGLSLAFVGLSVHAGIGCAPHVEEEPVDALDSALGKEDFDATVQHLTALPWLPWAYTTDGCYARALYYSMLLATKGVPTNHLYVLAKAGAPLDGIWAWHVAPAVTKDGDPNHVYVLDPVYDKTKALTNMEWVAHQGFTNPASSVYPSLHVHPGNSYLDQYDRRTPLLDPANPDAALYKEPTFAAMPAFAMPDVSNACLVMHRYIDWEPGSSAPVRTEKHRMLARETQRLTALLATKGKLSGDPSALPTNCTRGETLDGDPNGRSAETDETLEEDFVEPTRALPASP
jgi:hypothetical protein